MNWKRFWALLGLLAASLVLTGGEEPGENNGADQAPVIEEEMVVVGERAPVSVRETTAKVTVVDDERIERDLIQDTRDLVRYEPGVYVENDGERLGLGGFNIRGIGGNRVRTQIDGVRVAEQFSFGPIAVTQYALDVDSLRSVEILRSAGSSLYGSDALGGVVSFDTKDPIDYLAPTRDDLYLRLKAGYDGKDEGVNGGATAAFTLGSLEGLVTAVYRDSEARDNQGTVDAFDMTRTLPNDIDAASTQFLAKGVWRVSATNRYRLTVERFDAEADVNVYSQQGRFSQFGAIVNVSESLANDTQERLRVSLDQEMSGADRLLFDSLEWGVHFQTDETNQLLTERRDTAFGPAVQRVLRTGRVDFEQENLGADILLRKSFSGASATHRLTYGASIERFDFGQLRDRRELDLDTGNPDAYSGTLIFPTRYFPNSESTQSGLFVQSESHFFNGRLKVVPGLRYDRFELKPDENDEVYLASTMPEEPPASMDDQSVSPKLGVNYRFSDHVAVSGQYARGFRAPPYNSVNSGFTNVAGGYRTLPNPNLDPETSDNLEFAFKAYGQRGGVNVTWFDNRYSDFIDDTAFVGVSPQGLALFQPTNVDDARIEGLEIEGDWRLAREWRLRASYADIEGQNQTDDQPLASIEPAKLALGLRFRDRSDRFGGELHAVFSNGKSAADVPDDGASDPYLPDDYALFDLTLFWDILPELGLRLGAFNLSDETYCHWSDVRGRDAADPAILRYSAPGRHLSFNLTYQW